MRLSSERTVVETSWSLIKCWEERGEGEMIKKASDYTTETPSISSKHTTRVALCVRHGERGERESRRKEESSTEFRKKGQAGGGTGGVRTLPAKGEGGALRAPLVAITVHHLLDRCRFLYTDRSDVTCVPSVLPVAASRCTAL